MCRKGEIEPQIEIEVVTKYKIYHAIFHLYRFPSSTCYSFSQFLFHKTN